MAGDAVYWTLEMRQRLSEKMKAVRARETLEQKTARKEKRTTTMLNNPEIEVQRAAAISRTRNRRKKKLSTIARAAHTRKSSQAQQASLKNLEHGRTSTVRKRAAQNREQLAINKRISRGVKRNWVEMPLANKIERCRKSITTSLELYTLVDGSVGWFKGTWEPSCANVLLTLNIPYETQVVFDLGGYHYHADFVLPGNTIIEVKGNPHAWERWRSLTLPSILKFMDPQWRVYVLPRYEKNTYATLPDFLSTLDFVFGNG